MDSIHNTVYLEAESLIIEAIRADATELTLSIGDSENKLTELPPSLRTLTRLTHLEILYADLQMLPEWLSELSNLEVLRIEGSQLVELPAWIEKYKELRQLLLYGNALTTLPDSIRNLRHLKKLDIGGNAFSELPDVIFDLSNLQILSLSRNKMHCLPDHFNKLQGLQELLVNTMNLISLPESISRLKQLNRLTAWENKLSSLPESFRKLGNLKELVLQVNAFDTIPDWVSELVNLRTLDFWNNSIKDIPSSISKLQYLETLQLEENPLHPELAEVYAQGLKAVKAYLNAKAIDQIVLSEVKLILVGEGEVGKTCLMDALEGVPWQQHDSTHGIQIRSFSARDIQSGKVITLNTWDFGGQRVYRPTHQLFFSSPAVYLVVWKPREGPQQGFVKEWIKLIKHREAGAKILVVATHGGPLQRQPDIDRQELIDLFGKDTIIDFFFVDSKPGPNGERRGIAELKAAIANIAAGLPEVGRTVPRSWQNVRQKLQSTGHAYLPLTSVLETCMLHGMAEDEAGLFVTVSHRLGHLIHYEHDPALRDIVVLKPDWLATAISLILDDEKTRQTNGLVPFSRLAYLWNDPDRDKIYHYSPTLHKVFVRLMERFDLSYRVTGVNIKNETEPPSLIAQLVPDNRPEDKLDIAWPFSFFANNGDLQREQICKIIDMRNGQSTAAEGLFYQLIVRLHKYSLGRVNFNNSVHWQRGMVLDADYNGRALLEHIGNDVRITVRAPFPERLLAMLTEEVKYLVESFWEGLRCDVMVPCIEPCGRKTPGVGLFEVEKLIDSRRKNRVEYPCLVCNEWQNIECLLFNAPAAQRSFALPFFTEDIRTELMKISKQIANQKEMMIGRFDILDDNAKRMLSKVDDAYAGLMNAMTDEAREGPRLFSLIPVDRHNFNPRKWTSHKFRITLWCEHSRLPLPLINSNDSKEGIYEIEIARSWIKTALPYLKVLSGTLSLLLPVASSGIKLSMDDELYKGIEKQLDFSKEIVGASITGGEKMINWLVNTDPTDILEHGDVIKSSGHVLRQLHSIIKSQDPALSNLGLVRVMNKRQQFLWVHPNFEGEY